MDGKSDNESICILSEKTEDHTGWSTRKNVSPDGYSTDGRPKPYYADVVIDHPTLGGIGILTTTLEGTHDAAKLEAIRHDIERIFRQEKFDGEHIPIWAAAVDFTESVCPRCDTAVELARSWFASENIGYIDLQPKRTDVAHNHTVRDAVVLRIPRQALGEDAQEAKLSSDCPDEVVFKLYER